MGNIIRLTLLTLIVAACGGATAQPTPSSPTTLPSASASVAAAPAPPPVSWSDEWAVVDKLHGATAMWQPSCAATAHGVQCLGDVELGPLATTPITSPTVIWGFVYICGVASGGAFICNKPFADKPPQGPPHLTDVVSVDLHAAAHRDGTLSVTTSDHNYDPRWAKVKSVTDAVQVASSWYDGTSCFLRKSGEAACVRHAVDATPKPLGPVSDGARIWKTDKAVWILTRSGRLLGAKNHDATLTEVATGVVDFAPVAAPSGAAANQEIACAAMREGPIRCDLDGSWTLKPVPGTAVATRVFGGTDWFCAEDAQGVVRCIQHPKH